MTYRPLKLLIIADNEFDGEALHKQVADDYANEFVRAGTEHALDKFTADNDIVLISMKTVAEAERRFLELLRAVSPDTVLEHQVILLCQHREDARAVDLCISGTFDDYVVAKPYLDVHRLRWVLHGAASRLHETKNIAGQQDGIHQARRGYAELTALRAESINQSLRLRRLADETQRNMLSNVDGQITVLAQEMSSSPNSNSSETLRQAADKVIAYGREGLKPELIHYQEELTKPYATWLDQAHEQMGNIAKCGSGINESMARNVLLVDDDPLMRDMLRVVLESAGYQVSQAIDATHALMALSRHRPDVILLDYQLPDTDGITLTRRLREMAGMASIPVIMLTGQSERKIVERSMQAGAVDILVKPVGQHTLLDKLERLLGGQP